jgi:hypothetical protein
MLLELGSKWLYAVIRSLSSFFLLPSFEILNVIRVFRLVYFDPKRVLSAVVGEQGSDKEGGRPGLEQPISSPWDIVRLEGHAYAVAMAGSHQVGHCQAGGARLCRGHGRLTSGGTLSCWRGGAGHAFAVAMAGSHQVGHCQDGGARLCRGHGRLTSGTPV